MRPYTVILFRNSRADSSYVALVMASDQDEAINKAVDELVAADRREGMKTRPGQVCMGFLFEGQHHTGFHPGQYLKGKRS